jgi:hypothetical protein
MKLASSTRCRKVPEAPQQLSSHRRSPPNGHGATMRVAWSGYAAAKWSTESRLELAQAAILRNLATRADLRALSTRNAWFTAFTLDDPEKQAIAERRFRPEFKAAFDAWMATDPFRNPHAPPGPPTCPSTGSPSRPGRRPGPGGRGRGGGRPPRRSVDDDYIRTTVFLAAMLFLAGIGSAFKLHTVRCSLLAAR